MAAMFGLNFRIRWPGRTEKTFIKVLPTPGGSHEATKTSNGKLVMMAPKEPSTSRRASSRRTLASVLTQHCQKLLLNDAMSLTA